MSLLLSFVAVVVSGAVFFTVGVTLCTHGIDSSVCIIAHVIDVDSAIAAISEQSSQAKNAAFGVNRVNRGIDVSVATQVMELDSAVAAISGQPVEAQAACASLLVANGFFFAAMKAVFAFSEILRAVLEDVKSQVRGLQSTDTNFFGFQCLLLSYTD